MTAFILFGIFLLAMATLYASLKKRHGILFERICDACLVFISIHVIYALIARYTFGFDTAIDMAAPFALGYGPFFYIGLKSLDQKLRRKDIYIHFTPFLIFALLYVVLMTNEDYRVHYFMPFYITQYSLAAISFSGYIFSGLLLYPGLNKGEYSIEKKQLVKICCYSLGSMAFLLIVAVMSGNIPVENSKGEVPGLIVYSGLFISVILSFMFRINNLVSLARNSTILLPDAHEEIILQTEVLPLTEEKPVDEIKITGSIVAQKYNKSALSPAVLDDYRGKLDRFITIENVYLDNELTLEVLAKKMKIPMHHLTQLFNVYLGENFNQYINRFRIEYACRLLLDNAEALSIEQIAFKSGFNSKVSFNRHFKNITGTIPKEYIYNSKSTDN